MQGKELYAAVAAELARAEAAKHRAQAAVACADKV
jgi:hypothetical protein